MKKCCVNVANLTQSISMIKIFNMAFYGWLTKMLQSCGLSVADFNQNQFFEHGFVFVYAQNN